MSKISYRKVALLGAFMSTIGLLCIPFAPNIIFINIVYGVFTGLGFCFLYIPSSVLSGLYFESRRSLATGIAQAGYGLGGFLFPFLVYQLIKEYGWKGSIFIVNGINAHNFVFAALLRPIEPVKLPKALELSVEERKPMVEPGDEKFTHRQSIIQSNKLIALCDILFIIYFINNILWNFGTGILIVLGPEFVTEAGLDKKDTAIAFTLCGVGALIGSIIGGVVGNIKYVNRILLYSFANILLGVFILMLNIQTFQTFIGFCIINALWNLAFGVVLGLLVVVTADILGASLLSNGMGYVTLANGIGNISGPPIAGWLRDTYGTYYSSVCLSGSVLLISGFLMLIIPLHKHFRKSSEKIEIENFS